MKLRVRLLMSLVLPISSAIHMSRVFYLFYYYRYRELL